jgi:hypothetical protein
MKEKKIERRRTNRIVFDIHDELTAVLRDKEENIVRAHIYILNLSFHGMQFTTRSTDRSPFKIAERAILSEVHLNDQRYQNLDIEIIIRWILNPPALRYIGIGCEFLHIPDSSQKFLNEIISTKHH